MTDSEYQSLLKWCRNKKNHGAEEFKHKFFIKETALELKREIRGVVASIKDKLIWIGLTKNEVKLNTFNRHLNDLRDRKAELQKQFNELKL